MYRTLQTTHISYVHMSNIFPPGGGNGIVMLLLRSEFVSSPIINADTMLPAGSMPLACKRDSSVYRRQPIALSTELYLEEVSASIFMCAAASEVFRAHLRELQKRVCRSHGKKPAAPLSTCAQSNQALKCIVPPVHQHEGT
jgi:hypothetical protein